MRVYNDEICHTGKKGMKWGHHKATVAVSKNSNNSAGKTTIKKDANKLATNGAKVTGLLLANTLRYAQLNKTQKQIQSFTD